MDTIFEIHDIDDVIEVLNSDLRNIREAESPTRGVLPPCYADVVKLGEQSSSEEETPEQPEGDQGDEDTPSDPEGYYQTAMSRAQRRAMMRRRASLTLDIPSRTAEGMGSGAPNRFAPTVTPRISSMCHLLREPTIHALAMEREVEMMGQANEETESKMQELEKFCLAMLISDDLDKLMFKLSVNQSLVTGLLLKPRTPGNRVAIKIRTRFGEALYQQIRILVNEVKTEKYDKKDKANRERIVRFAKNSKC